ncbi:MAG: hypothetical protein ACREIA_05780 [Opitutaceae bacterium]
MFENIAERGEEQPAALALKQIVQRTQRMLAGEAVVERMLVGIGLGGHGRPGR